MLKERHLYGIVLCQLNSHSTQCNISTNFCYLFIFDSCLTVWPKQKTDIELSSYHMLLDHLMQLKLLLITRINLAIVQCLGAEKYCQFILFKSLYFIMTIAFISFIDMLLCHIIFFISCIFECFIFIMPSCYEMFQYISFLF